MLCALSQKMFHPRKYFLLKSLAFLGVFTLFVMESKWLSNSFSS